MKKTILLICTTGLTTNILVAKMQKLIFAKDLPLELIAVPASQLETEFTHHPADAILLSPQVRYLRPIVERLINPKQIPYEVINMAAYGMMDEVRILDSACKLLEEKSS